MRYIAFALVLLLGTLAHAADWKLVWSDEFNYTGAPDPAKWDYETGFIRNNESQFYTRRLENARVEGGMLIIEGRKERIENPDYALDAGGMNGHTVADYTSASLITKGKMDWTYGRIEVRAKVPAGAGTWPAIWMLGTDIDRVSWPACGEIDIMEFLGREGNQIHGSLHWRNEANRKHASRTGTYPLATASNDFHTYAVEWTPDHLDFFVDSAKYETVSLDEAGVGPDNPFRHPQYLILNLALGGDWGKKIDDTAMPAKFIIDYVRVYQQAESGPPAAATAPAK